MHACFNFALGLRLDVMVRGGWPGCSEDPHLTRLAIRLGIDCVSVSEKCQFTIRDGIDLALFSWLRDGQRNFSGVAMWLGVLVLLFLMEVQLYSALANRVENPCTMCM